MRLVFDIEGNELEEKCTLVHCIVAQDLDAGTVYMGQANDGSLDAVLLLLSGASELWGHNITGYDLPVLARLCHWRPSAHTAVLDTLHASKQAYPGNQLKVRDALLVQRGTLPKDKVGLHSLEAWGYRLGCRKAEYDGGFEKFSPEMLRYCVQDVALTAKLVAKLLTRTPSSVIELESAVGAIVFEQQKVGVGFDTAKAVALTARLTARREVLGTQLRETFGSWYAPKGKLVTPKRGMTSKKYAPGEVGYVNVAAGCAYQPIELVEFNPASGAHIARVLQKQRGWEPKEFTDGGMPKTGEEILADLPWPEARLLVEYQNVKKVLGYVSEGEGAWLRAVKKDGRIHGKVHPTGAVTNRSSHVSPNLGQVPADPPYGPMCRELFIAAPGRVLCGADAAGLQLRLLGHYLAPYDGGAFARVTEDGDVHEYLRHGTGFVYRKLSKNAHYAWIFGAGFYKLGTMFIGDRLAAIEAGLVAEDPPRLSQAPALGRQVKAGLVHVLKMGRMVDNLNRAAKRGFLRSLDGRSIPVLSQHTALCSLLQGAEAVVMKLAMVRAKRRLTPDARQVLWVHDEFQIECLPGTAEHNGKRLVEAIVETGEALGLRVRLDGAFKVGTNWSETH